MKRRIRFWFEQDLNQFRIKIYKEGIHENTIYLSLDHFVGFCKTLQALNVEDEVQLANDSDCELY